MFSFLFPDKKERTIELFNSSQLPKHGWIQFCKNCDIRTCQTFEFKRVETKETIYIFIVYLCKTCKRENIINDEKFKTELNEYIENNYLFAGGTETT